MQRFTLILAALCAPIAFAQLGCNNDVPTGRGSGAQTGNGGDQQQQDPPAEEPEEDEPGESQSPEDSGAMTDSAMTDSGTVTDGVTEMDGGAMDAAEEVMLLR